MLMPPQPLPSSNSSGSRAGSGDASPLAKEFPAWDLMPPAILVRRRRISSTGAAPAPPQISDQSPPLIRAAQGAPPLPAQEVAQPPKVEP